MDCLGEQAGSGVIATASEQRATTAIAVLPNEARTAYAQLLDALQEAYPVRFVGAHELEGAAGLVVFPGGTAPPRLDVPCLALEAPEPAHGRGTSFRVELSRNVLLDRPLHAQRLLEHRGIQPTGIGANRGDVVLACSDGKPIWTCTGNGRHRERASALPCELEPGAFLRDHLRAGHFWSLLPLAHFLKRICDEGRQPHPTAACFVLDDANVRASSYGYVRFPALAADARAHAYHVAVAAIPLDLVLPPRRGVRFFRENRPALSLVVHGNDHLHHEMERARSPAEADRLVGSAEARVRRFEERTDVAVERIMCPPHGTCGPETLAALARWGFRGLTASGSFPWEGFDDHRRWRLGGWLPAQLAGGGIPILPRYPLTANLDDLVFRAFLGQPLILYCHHDDLREGFDSFHAAVARVADLGGARWESLASIAASNANVRLAGNAATVTLYSCDVCIPRPAAPVVRVEVPRIFGRPEALRLVVDGVTHELHAGAGTTTMVVQNRRTEGALRIRLEAPRATAASRAAASWRPKAWPLARRVINEARDRVRPLVPSAGA